MIGQKIKEIRLKKGLTQLELAESIKKNQSDIARWEKGHTIPKLCNIHKIAKALKVNILELI